MAHCIAVNVGVPLTVASDDLTETFRAPVPEVRTPTLPRDPCVEVLHSTAFSKLSATWLSLESALADGRGVVWHPPLEAPLPPQVVAQAVEETSALPRGLINIVHGVPPHVSPSATTRIGLLQDGATPATMEAAVARLQRQMCEHAGQQPADVHVVFVPHSQWLPFIRDLGKRFSALRVGHPLDPVTQVGPVLDGVTLDRCLSTVLHTTTRHGARVVVGGYMATFPAGYFVPPTIVTDVADHETALTTEWRGPVVCIQRFRNLEAEVLPLLRRADRVVVTDARLDSDITTDSW